MKYCVVILPRGRTRVGRLKVLNDQNDSTTNLGPIVNDFQLLERVATRWIRLLNAVFEGTESEHLILQNLFVFFLAYHSCLILVFPIRASVRFSEEEKANIYRPQVANVNSGTRVRVRRVVFSIMSRWGDPSTVSLPVNTPLRVCSTHIPMNRHRQKSAASHSIHTVARIAVWCARAYAYGFCDDRFRARTPIYITYV